MTLLTKYTKELTQEERLSLKKWRDSKSKSKSKPKSVIPDPSEELGTAYVEGCDFTEEDKKAFSEAVKKRKDEIADGKLERN